jgi:hypothetical protein
MVEAACDRRSEVLDACRQALQVVALDRVSFEGLVLMSDLRELRFKVAAARLELVERQHFRLVGVGETLDATIDLRTSPSQFASTRLSVVCVEPSIVKTLHGILEHSGFVEHLAYIVPHEAIDPCGGYLARMTRLPTAAVGEHILPRQR